MSEVISNRPREPSLMCSQVTGELVATRALSARASGRCSMRPGRPSSSMTRTNSRRVSRESRSASVERWRIAAAIPLYKRDRLIGADDQHAVAVVVGGCEQHERLDHRVHLGRDRLDQADGVAQQGLARRPGRAWPPELVCARSTRTATSSKERGNRGSGHAVDELNGESRRPIRNPTTLNVQIGCVAGRRPHLTGGSPER